MHHENRPCQAGGCGDFLLKVSQHIADAVRGGAGLVVVPHELFLELHQRVIAGAGRGNLRNFAQPAEASVTQQVVPDHLLSVLRQRKRDATGGGGHAVAAVRQLGGADVGLGGVVNILRRGGAAARGIHRHLVSGGIPRQKRLVPFGEVVGVLLGVGRCDSCAWLVGGERVGVMIARLVTGRRLCDAPLPGGDGAGGVAGLLGSKRRQAFAQVGRTLSRCCSHARSQCSGGDQIKTSVTFHC